MQRERRNCGAVKQLLYVGLPVREACWIHTKEVVGEHPTIRVSISIRESPPHLGLKPDEVLELKLCHGVILSARYRADGRSTRSPQSPCTNKPSASACRE